jgi:hypothetical protein
MHTSYKQLQHIQATSDKTIAINVVKVLKILQSFGILLGTRGWSL